MCASRPEYRTKTERFMASMDRLSAALEKANTLKEYPMLHTAPGYIQCVPGNKFDPVWR